MSLKGKASIFDAPTIDIDPASIRLISDRCLIRDLGHAEKIGSIIIPETVRDEVSDWGRLRIGEVIATGPGDRFIEVGYDDMTGVRRKLITASCSCRWYFDMRAYEVKEDGDPSPDCGICYGTGRFPITIPPQCEPGQRVLYSRRREAEIVVNGELLSIVNAEQSILGVLED